MRSQIGYPGTADAQTPRSPSRPVVLRRQAFCAALGLHARLTAQDQGAGSAQCAPDQIRNG